jgi:hypothetical protein
MMGVLDAVFCLMMLEMQRCPVLFPCWFLILLGCCDIEGAEIVLVLVEHFSFRIRFMFSFLFELIIILLLW